jgi:hypothetical protein
MTFENSILGRCCAAYETRFHDLGTYDDEIPLCVAAVLDHLAGEILVLNQQDPRLTVERLAKVLMREAASVELEPVEPLETWDNHPSLTAAERNPSLR